MKYTTNPTKHNFIVIQAYPANHTLSQGFIDLLSDYFNVFFIDLPGFHPDVAPLDNIKLSNYFKFVEESIENLDLDSYILGGISFGALLANNVKIDDRCIAMVSMAPFLGIDYLYLNPVLQDIIKFGISRFKSTHQLDDIWSKSFIWTLYSNYMHMPKYFFDILSNEVDSRTYILTADMLLRYHKKPKFQKRPYLILLNPDCKVVRYKETLSMYVDNVQEMKLIHISLEHFPKELDKESLARHITEDNILKGIEYLESVIEKEQFLKGRNSFRMGLA